MRETDIANAEASADSYERPTVQLTLRKDAAKRLADFTDAHKGGRLAVLVNDKVQYAAIISSKISDGKIMIGGLSSEQEAEALADKISGR